VIRSRRSSNSVKRLLLILVVIVAQLFAVPSGRAVVSDTAERTAAAHEQKEAGRLDDQVRAARNSVVQFTRSRTRTRDQRTSIVSVSTSPAARFASIVGLRSTTDGTINAERFIALGLPDTRAP